MLSGFYLILLLVMFILNVVFFFITNNNLLVNDRKYYDLLNIFLTYLTTFLLLLLMNMFLPESYVILDIIILFFIPVMLYFMYRELFINKYYSRIINIPLIVIQFFGLLFYAFIAKEMFLDYQSISDTTLKRAALHHDLVTTVLNKKLSQMPKTTIVKMPKTNSTERYFQQLMSDNPLPSSDYHISESYPKAYIDSILYS